MARIFRGGRFWYVAAPGYMPYHSVHLTRAEARRTVARLNGRT